MIRCFREFRPATIGVILLLLGGGPVLLAPSEGFADSACKIGSGSDSERRTCLEKKVEALAAEVEQLKRDVEDIKLGRGRVMPLR